MFSFQFIQIPLVSSFTSLRALRQKTPLPADMSSGVPREHSQLISLLKSSHPSQQILDHLTTKHARAQSERSAQLLSQAAGLAPPPSKDPSHRDTRGPAAQPVCRFLHRLARRPAPGADLCEHSSFLPSPATGGQHLGSPLPQETSISSVFVLLPSLLTTKGQAFGSPRALHSWAMHSVGSGANTKVGE